MKLKSMMKRFANLLAVFILSVNCISAQNLTRWVNPFIGTGAVQSSLSGNNYPGATVPFGMVQLSPDTREAPDWAQASGYDYNDSIFRLKEFCLCIKQIPVKSRTPHKAAIIFFFP